MTDRRKWKTGLSIGALSEEALERAAKARLDLVEINALKEDTPEEWKKIPEWSKNTGVQVWSIHLPFRPKEPRINLATWDEEEWQYSYQIHKRLIESAASGGIGIAVIHSCSMRITEEERESRVQAAIEHLGILSRVCRENGVTLAVENLPLSVGRSVAEMERIVQSNSDLRVCFDVNHLLQDDHETYVRRLKDYIVTTHISDYDFLGEKHWFPMQGQINWRKLQTALEEADYNGPFLYEAHSIGHTWEDVRDNHEKLKDL